MGINLDGERGILGMWVGPTGGEGAKQWANMLTELRNRGILDACIVCCDGLRGLPDAILATWPNASAQTCVVHLVRNTLRYASKKVLADHHQTDAADLPRRRSRLPRTQFELAEFAEKWEPTYPAMVAMWRRSWPRVHPVPGVPGRGPQIMFSTNGIESLNARFWAATRRRGHFPDEQSALKVLYLAATQRHKNRTNPTGQIPGWKGILNVLSMTYGNRLGLN